MNGRVPVLRVAVVSASLTWACVKVPEFTFRDAGTNAGDAGDALDAPGDDAALPSYGATAYMGAGGHVFGAVADLYELEFSGEGFKFPFRMRVGGTEVFGGGPSGCRDSRGVGVSFAPGYVFTGLAGSANLTDDTITIDVPGPPIAKVSLSYGTALGCSAMPSGKTTYTFFPDGRITRMDVARMPATATANDCECEVTADDDWHVEGYTAFNRNVINTVQAVGVPAIGTSAAAPNPSCIVGNGSAYNIAMGWYAGASGQTISRPDDGTLVLSKPLVGAAPTITGGGASAIGDAITTMWVGLGSTSCATLIGRTTPFTEDRQLILDNGISANPIGIAQDGLYGGETSGAAPGRDPGGALAILSPPGGASLGAFAIWLQFGTMNSIKSVTKLPTTPAAQWYWEQTIAGKPSQRIFWFPDGLQDGESIRIEAE